MSITQAQISTAQEKQHRAAQDPRPQVRLIAGPGSGKSFAIQERVSWLLQNGISPDQIFVVSFTRASTQDLRTRIVEYCLQRGQDAVEQVSISTLHSLALRSLRAAGLLAYPANPLVMDDWELENIIDPEFSRASGFRPGQAGVGYRPGRCKDIRRDFEAFCGTGLWSPPNFIPPDPPLSDVEREDYLRFHRARTQAYSCVLPGEIIRQCIENMGANLLNPAELLSIAYLIVDEYQDLNPSDLDFVDGLVHNGVATFVAGDDDQSIYSFRFASPAGIQSFVERFPSAGHYELDDCFRCTPAVLRTAQALLAEYSEPNRVPKNLTSLYETSDPPEVGKVHRWRFPSAIREARSIAESCSKLIAEGIAPQKIMILISNKRALLSTLISEFDRVEIDHESPRSDSFLDTNAGRFILALLRIACDAEDYVAHRLILGLRPHVGPATCNEIAELVIVNNLNYRDLFYQPLPSNVFRGRALTAMNHARSICDRIKDWSKDDSLSDHAEEIIEILQSTFDEQISYEWESQISELPDNITLEELRDYLWADTDEQQASIIETVFSRLEIPIPEVGFLPPRIRIMTMHGAKGLSANVVFIPGLMEEILPGNLRRPYPGLVLEAARMLYVSITRARAACVLSFATTRLVYGEFSPQSPSRFSSMLNGPFISRENGLSSVEAREIAQSVTNL